MNDTIGLRIKELRKENKLTQLEFSSKISIDNSQLSKIEQGKLMPTLNQLVEISSIFDISLDYLINNKKQNYSSEEKIIIDEPNPIRDKLIVAQQELLDYKDGEIKRLKDRIDILEIENTNLKNKRYSSETSYPMVAESKHELTKKGK